jgi:hypothetical protein
VIEAAGALPGTLLIDTLDMVDDVGTVELGLDNLEIKVLIVIDSWDLLLLKGDLVEIDIASLEFLFTFVLLVLCILVFHFCVSISLSFNE